MEHDKWKKIRRELDKRYEDWKPFGEFVCVYCGWDGYVIDHVPSILSCYIGEYKNLPHIRVPACRQCNSILGSKTHGNIVKRCRYLLIVYEKKYEKILDSPEWSEEEIAEMGPRMSQYLVDHERVRKMIEHKLDHIDKAIEFYLVYLREEK